jgi:hypothetical protein
MKPTLRILLILLMPLTVFAQKGIVNNGSYLRVENGAKLLVEGSADGNLTNTSGGTISLDGWLTLEGSLDNSGAIIIKNGASLIDHGTDVGSGGTVVQKNITSDTLYFISSPLQGLAVNDFPNCVLKKYNTGSSEWEDLTGDESVYVMNGYDLSLSLPDYSALLELSGILNTGNHSLALSSSGQGWNLAGNPYPSGLDWNSSGWNKTGIDNTLYLWNGQNHSYYIAGSGLSANNGSAFIPPMSAFFVKSNTNGTLGVNNDARVHEIQNENSKSALGDYLRISVTKNNYHDETLINFTPEASPDFDSEYDAYKLITLNSLVPQIYTKANDVALAINSQSCNGSSVVIPLNFESGANGGYSFDFTDHYFSYVKNLYIVDTVSGDQLTPVYSDHQLKREKYDFDYNINDSPERFALHFVFSDNCSPTDIENQLSDVLPDIYSIEKTVFIMLKNNENNNARAFIYNILGKLIQTSDLEINSLNSIYLDKPDGCYIVKVLIDDEVYTGKVILRQ